MENKKKSMNIEITEMFMAKADWGRCFHGTVTRSKDENGNEILHGKIFVKNDQHDCIIYAMSTDRNTLGEMLDEMVIMILDMGLHLNATATFKTISTYYYLN